VIISFYLSKALIF
jgi:regulator of replication initiation timing